MKSVTKDALNVQTITIWQICSEVTLLKNKDFYSVENIAIFAV